MKRLLAGILCTLLLSFSAFGQTDLSTIVGHEKKPYKDTVLLTKPLPPLEAKQFEAALHRIRDVILSTPAVRDLRGHDWETFSTIKNHEDPRRPVLATVTYIPFRYFNDPRTGKTASSEEGPPFSIHVNDPEAILGQGSYSVDAEARFTIEPRTLGQVNGFPVFDGHFVVVSSRREPVFVPVSQQRYLTRLIEKARKELTETSARLNETPEDPAVKQREIASRQSALKAARDEQEKRWAVMQSKWPDRVAAERAKFDEKEKKALAEIEELKTSSPRQRYLLPFEARLKGLEAELAALSPAEKTAPAYFPRNPNKDRASGLAAPGADGTRIVTINPALFDATKPKSAIQLIVLGTTQYEPTLYDQVQQQIDYTALANLIE